MQKTPRETKGNPRKSIKNPKEIFPSDILFF